jgi:hypothetical protein
MGIINKKEHKTSFLKKIQLWWKFEGQYYHTDFIEGIKNLKKWFRVVWKDRDWDDHYIWEIMIFKIKKQAKYIGDRDFHTRAKRDAEIMMTCVRLMDKVRNEDYQTEYMDYHESDFDFVPIEGDSEHSRLEITEISENFDQYFKKYPLTYHKIMKNGGIFGNDSKQSIAMSMGRLQHEKARKILFTLLQRNIECWWD